MALAASADRGQPQPGAGIDRDLAPVDGAAGCPNPQWTEGITDLAFTSATITVEQGGDVVLTLSCSISPPTSGGIVPRGNVSCTSS
jgi:hypothetical protein